MLKTIDTAVKIFSESLTAVMAHAIRGTQNHFYAHGVTLQVRIVPDKHDRLKLREPGRGVTSILWTNLVKHNVDYLSPTVNATIHIHQYANRNLARICVAHEIFHLLMELHAYEQSGRKHWKQIRIDRQVEDECNQFAWELCFKHDRFYRDDERRKASVYFPEGLFERPFNVDLNQQDLWGPGVGLDPEHPFYKMEHLS